MNQTFDQVRRELIHRVHWMHIKKENLAYL